MPQGSDAARSESMDPGGMAARPAEWQEGQSGAGPATHQGAATLVPAAPSRAAHSTEPWRSQNRPAGCYWCIHIGGDKRKGVTWHCLNRCSGKNTLKRKLLYLYYVLVFPITSVGISHFVSSFLFSLYFFHFEDK